MIPFPPTRTFNSQSSGSHAHALMRGKHVCWRETSIQCSLLHSASRIGGNSDVRARVTCTWEAPTPVPLCVLGWGGCERWVGARLGAARPSNEIPTDPTDQLLPLNWNTAQHPASESYTLTRLTSYYCM